MTDSKRILILTADAGFGHRSAANAVAAALGEIEGETCQVDIVNPLEDKRLPFFLRDSGSDYDKIVRKMPELYQLGYDASDGLVTTTLVESALVVLLYEVMRDVVKKYQPDAILSTYPLYQAPLVALFTIERVHIPVFTTVTDLVTVHRLWFNKGVDACLVPTPLAEDLALANGMPPEKVRVTGIPVQPGFARDRRNPAEIRAELGWQQNLVTFLAVGSRRVDRLVDTLHVLNHFGVPLQLCVVAGKDAELYQELEEMDWHVPAVHLYEFTNAMPAMMMAADAIICKAGGLVVTESLAAGRPLMLIDVLPGQETGNAEYVLQNGAADLAQSPVEVLEVAAHWLAQDHRLLRQRAENAARLGRPAAAFNVAKMLLHAAELGPVSKRGRRIAGRPRLVDLLTKNNIDWNEHLLPSQSESEDRIHVHRNPHL